MLRDRLTGGITTLNLENDLIHRPKYCFQDARIEYNNDEEVHETGCQDAKNSTTLLSYPNPMRTQGHTDERLINDNPRSSENMDNHPLRSCNTSYRGDHMFCECLFRVGRVIVYNPRTLIIQRLHPIHNRAEK
ncbi:unnamed protein product [Schistosoma curassoni]|uniref:Uncharacterized protein n=1 Tax=Schistosoma curassoni TaxID=6186 RepID=A0A183K2E4_9TREM|nr:unnamed protein product [Schistosoma curassoni]